MFTRIFNHMYARFLTVASDLRPLPRGVDGQTMSSRYTERKAAGTVSNARKTS